MPVLSMAEFNANVLQSFKERQKREKEMNVATMTIQPNPYKDSNWCAGFDWSVQVPNDISGLTMHSTMDGDQPSYNREFTRKVECLFQVCGLHFKSVADYPKDGNTLRYMFTTESAADLAIAIIEGIDV